MSGADKTQAEFEAFSGKAARKRVGENVRRFLEKHAEPEHDVSECEFQGCTRLMCHTPGCDEDYIIVN